MSYIIVINLVDSYKIMINSFCKKCTFILEDAIGR